MYDWLILCVGTPLLRRIGYIYWGPAAALSSFRCDAVGERWNLCTYAMGYPFKVSLRLSEGSDGIIRSLRCALVCAKINWIK